MLNKSFFLFIAVSILLSASVCLAGGKREKVIDFEDEVVEGMNKRPLDSLSEIAERGKKRHRPHLYKKRVGFKSETSETLHAVRQVQ